MSANNTQIGGDHYQSGYQHWDFVQRTLQGRYLEGCIAKYVSRWRKKNGLQDLQKASHYLTKLIEEFGARRVAPLGLNALAFEDARLFNAVNKLGTYESTIITCIATWSDVRTLLNAQTALKELTEDADLHKECPAPKKLGAGALKVAINIEDIPGVQKVRSEAAEAIKISERLAVANMKADVADKNFGIAAAECHEAKMVLSRIREAFGLRPDDGASLAEFAELLMRSDRYFTEKAAALGNMNHSLNKQLQKLSGESAKLGGLLNSERDTIRLLLKTQRDLVGEHDMLRAAMEAREKQPPKNAEAERLEAEVTRLATELNRVRGEKE